MISAGRGNVFHAQETQDKQTDMVGIQVSETRGHNADGESSWMPVDSTRSPSLRTDFSAASRGEGGRPHIPVDSPRQELFTINTGFLLTLKMPLF